MALRTAMRRDLKETYSPLFMLASLGNGGMAVTFFIYLMFMTPHPNTPIPTFDSLFPLITSENRLTSGLILLAMGLIIFFAFRHFSLLIWNLREYVKFRKTDAHAALRQSNAEVSLMAIPLTLAMSVNVSFILGAVFVPGLWNYVEYLFVMPLVAFSAIGVYAMSIVMSFFTRVLSTGNFDCTRNNNLGQMVPVFALTMIAVGFAAPAAMSTVKLTASLGMLGSIFFLSAAGLLGAVKFILGFRSMLEHGINKENSVSLWIIIPILTLVGITGIRLLHGLHHHFEFHTQPVMFLILTSLVASAQLLFGMLGFFVMRRVEYFKTYVDGGVRSPGSYALICPGVAFFVFGMFLLNPGLVQNGIIAKFSPAYFLVLLPLVFVQFRTILVMFKLDRKLLRVVPSVADADAVAA